MMKPSNTSLDWVVLCLLTMLHPATAVSQPVWSGFDELVKLGTSIGFEVTTPRRSGRVLSDDTLLLIEPRCMTIHSDSLKQFVDAGGRAIIFTEQPGPKNCLSAFGISLAQAKSPSHEHGPLIPLKLSPTFEGADAIAGFVVANRPLRLTGLHGREALLSTYAGESIGAQLKYGRGDVIIFSDVSIVINQMLSAPSNFAFIETLLKPSSAQTKRGIIVLPGDDWSFSAQTETRAQAVPVRIQRLSLFALGGIAGIFLVTAILIRLAQAKNVVHSMTYRTHRPATDILATSPSQSTQPEGNNT
ncbi:MAG: DUF4350 domain-containing protein [Bradymonadia bacterium]